jgi:hypothetical protein
VARPRRDLLDRVPETSNLRLWISTNDHTHKVPGTIKPIFQVDNLMPDPSSISEASDSRIRSLNGSNTQSSPQYKIHFSG